MKGNMPDKGSKALPELIESVRGFNLICFKGLFYGVPQAFGTVDFYETDISSLEGVIVEESVDSLKAAILSQSFSNDFATPLYVKKVGAIQNKKIHSSDEKIIDAPAGTPMLVEEMAGFNLIVMDKVYYGVPYASGNIDIKKEHEDVCVAPTLEALKIKIKNLRPEILPAKTKLPENFKIIKFNGGFVMVEASDLDEQEIDEEPTPGMISRTKRALGFQKGLRLIDVVGKTAEPEVLQVIGNYNVVEFDGVYYGAKHGIEISNWHDSEQRNHSEFITANTEKELRRKILDIAQPEKTQIKPQLRQAIGNYNIVEFNGVYYGVQHGIEITDWHDSEQRNNPELITANSEEEIRDKVLTKLS